MDNLVNSTEVIKIVDYLNDIITPIGVHVYEIYYKQMLYTGIIDTSVYGIGIIALPYIMYKSYRYMKIECEKNKYSSLEILGPIAIVIMFLIFIFCIINISTSIMQIVNPDYYIIQDLLNKV